MLVVVFTSGIAQDQPSLREGKKLFKAGDWRGALPMLAAVVQNQPENLEANALYGACLVHTEQAYQALPFLEKAWKANPKLVDNLGYLYGQALHANYRFDEAIVRYREESTRHPVTTGEFKAISMRMAQCKFAKELILKPVPVEIENLGPQINTAYPEYAPVINADETVIVFTSRRPGNLGGVRKEMLLGSMNNDYFEDVYISYFENDAWTEARNLGPPVNTEGQDAPVALSPDGQQLFIHRDENGGDIFWSQLEGDQWTTPVNLGPPVNSPHWEPSVCVSADGNTLFFTSDRPGGAGKRDLYWCERRPDGRWSAPRNLGQQINTLLDEDAPFFHPDGKTLYFSSEGHKGMGGFDVFKTVRQADGSWSKPVNLGHPINTPGDDLYFVLSANGRRGYYSSAVGAVNYGGKDIYRITFLKSDTLPATPTASLTLLKGVISDAKTRKPLEATVLVIDNETGDTLSVLRSNRRTGRYLVALPHGKNYGIVAVCPGYLFCSENVDIPVTEQQYQEVRQDLELQGLLKGSKVVLNNIFFDFDKSTLRKESQPELNRLVRLLRENPRLRLRIGGHTDSKGSDEYNLRLSQDRAQSVVNFLVENGIDRTRLEAKGYGEAVPVATNETSEGRQRNRRTEFEILDN
jgi:outer membrane protein OmpA-like peptidoglycan-associated protein